MPVRPTERETGSYRPRLVMGKEKYGDIEPDFSRGDEITPVDSDDPRRNYEVNNILIDQHSGVLYYRLRSLGRLPQEPKWKTVNWEDVEVFYELADN